MTRHYSPRDFFRNMPNALLARYFNARGVLQDFDFAALKEAKGDALLDAWMTLTEAVRVKLGAELRGRHQSRRWRDGGAGGRRRSGNAIARAWPHAR